MQYPNDLPSPLLDDFKINIPFSVKFFNHSRKPIPQPPVTAKISFFLSQESLEKWNKFFYNDLKHGTDFFQVDWDGFKTVKFIGNPSVTTVGNLFYKLNVGIISLNYFSEFFQQDVKNYCELLNCTEMVIRI